MMLELLVESALRSIVLGAAAWLGLTLGRVRNPQMQMTAWTVVLVVSLAMPALTPWMRIKLPVDEPQARLMKITWANALAIASQAPTVRPALATSQPDAAAMAPAPGPAFGFDWRLLATGTYSLVGGIMLLRLLIGSLLMWRVVRAARPVRDGWTAGADVRVSDLVVVPVTFASTILLPSASSAWTKRKLRAVLLHEGSHVAHGDFYVLLLAAINRAVFWFNPFAWWLFARLAGLAETVSDNAAIAGLNDRGYYADILLDVARDAYRLPAGLPMARPTTVHRRVQRILAATAVPAWISLRRRRLIAAALLPLASLSATTIARSTAPVVPPTADLPIDTAQLDRYIGQFLISGASVLTVTRNREQLFAQTTGEPRLRLIALSDHDFITERGDENLAFVIDGDRPAAAVALRDPVTGLRRRPRVDAATASEIEANFERRVAAAPDRFRDQIPTPGGSVALRAMIENLRRDAPGDVRMSRQLTDRVRAHVPPFRDTLSALGAVELIFFRGVGPGGYDIYGVKFANGSAEFRIDLAADGTIEDFNFRPDGDGSPGAIVACAREPTLRSSSDTAPIRLTLTNHSGADIRLFGLDSDGRRLSRGTLANKYSMDVLTNTSRPLIIADLAGQCREIILPGLLTRVHAVEPLQPGDSLGQPEVLRTTPMAGSEQALQRYIESVRRGVPDYDRMTPEAGAKTRQLLPQGQAILAKFGALRAMSFRGVTQAGNDVYMVHFANGSAEWQIGLVDEGRIGRMVLGPQY